MAAASQGNHSIPNCPNNSKLGTYKSFNKKYARKQARKSQKPRSCPRKKV